MRILSLNSISLSRKLPVIIASIGLAASLAVAILSYLDFRHSFVDLMERKLEVLTEERAHSLQQWGGGSWKSICAASAACHPR